MTEVGNFWIGMSMVFSGCDMCCSKVALLLSLVLGQKSPSPLNRKHPKSLSISQTNSSDLNPYTQTELLNATNSPCSPQKLIIFNASRISPLTTSPVWPPWHSPVHSPLCDLLEQLQTPILSTVGTINSEWLLPNRREVCISTVKYYMQVSAQKIHCVHCKNN